MIKTFGAALPADPLPPEGSSVVPTQTPAAAMLELALALGAFLLLAGFLPPLMYAVANPWLPDMPFAKYASRALLVGAVLALGPVMWRQWRLTLARTSARNGDGTSKAVVDVAVPNARRSAVQLALSPLAGGFLFGVLSLAALCAAHIAAGAREWSGGLLVQTAINAMVTGWLISVAEELVFRGGLQTLFIRIAGGPAGWIATALLFALAHFLKPGEFAPQEVTWLSGFEALGWAAAPLAQADTYGIRRVSSCGIDTWRSGMGNRQSLGGDRVACRMGICAESRLRGH
jgi:membrane protease YdiL (CAAX protease family)